LSDLLFHEPALKYDSATLLYQARRPKHSKLSHRILYSIELNTRMHVMVHVRELEIQESKILVTPPIFSIGWYVFIGIAEIIVILNEPTLKRSQAHYQQPEMTYHNHVAANYMRPDTQHQPHDIQTKKTLTIGVQRALAPMCEASPQKRQTSSDSAKLASYQMTASLLLWKHITASASNCELSGVFAYRTSGSL
jgi:hypothetical protein